MSPPKPTKKRPYQRHGLYAVQEALKTIGNSDGWVDRLGPVGTQLKAWQASIIADLGGIDNISAMELSIVELATRTYLMLESIDRFLLEQSSLVNKSRRQVFPVVLQRQALADALAKYMGQLGLKRRAKPAKSLADVLASRGRDRPRLGQGRPDRKTPTGRPAGRPAGIEGSAPV